MWSNTYGPNKPKVGKVELRRIGAFFKPYWLQNTILLCCMLGSSLLGLIPLIITARIIDHTIPHGTLHELAIDVAIILGAAFITIAFTVVQGYLNSVVGEGIMRDMRTSLVSHLHKMPISFFTGTKTGEIMNRVSNDVDNIDKVVTGTLTSILTNVAMILTTVIWMFIWN